ncbi:MAG: DUF2927 domain-containing protein [Pseudomonadota bacterium]
MPINEVGPQGRTGFRNGELAALLVRLAFEFEDGSRLAAVERLPMPIRVVPASGFDRALSDVVAARVGWLQRHGALDIGFQPNLPADPPTPGSGTVVALQTVREGWLRQVAPSVGCFILPGPPIRAENERRALDFTELKTRWAERNIVTVYLPEGIGQPILDACLFEEILQSLGVYNDIFDLLPSIFNDDGLHVFPTALDLLLIRTFYAVPETALSSRERMMAEARAALAALNPEGEAPDAPSLGLAPRPVIARVRASYEAAARRNDGRVDLDTVESLIGDTAQGFDALQCMLRGHAVVLNRRAGDPDTLQVIDGAAARCREAGTDVAFRLTNLAAQRGLFLVANNRPGDALATFEGVPEMLDAHGRGVEATDLRRIQARLREITADGR